MNKRTRCARNPCDTKICWNIKQQHRTSQVPPVCTAHVYDMVPSRPQKWPTPIRSARRGPRSNTSLTSTVRNWSPSGPNWTDNCRPDKENTDCPSRTCLPDNTARTATWAIDANILPYSSRCSTHVENLQSLWRSSCKWASAPTRYPVPTFFACSTSAASSDTHQTRSDACPERDLT